MTYQILTTGILKQFYPLNTFPDDLIELVMQQVKVDNIYRGNVIFRQGANDTDAVYLISGSIQLKSDEGASFILESESDKAVYPLANIKPRKFSAYVHSDSAAVARIPSKNIESLMFNLEKDKLWTSGSVATESDVRVLDSEWMMAMKKTPLFQKLDEESINELFHVMDEESYKAGSAVIKEGEEGEFFYLIKEGQCKVTSNNDNNQAVLAELGPTDSFGEEALLSKAKRNATVTMTTDGVLMLISKKDFEQFMFQPMVQWISSADAKQLLKEGAIPVDVRRPSADKSTLKKAIQVPLSKLREQIVDLDTKSKYLILCDNKREAAVSSFLFSKHGLDGYILRGENAPKSK